MRYSHFPFSGFETQPSPRRLEGYTSAFQHRREKGWSPPGVRLQVKFNHFCNRSVYQWLIVLYIVLSSKFAAFSPANRFLGVSQGRAGARSSRCRYFATHPPAERITNPNRSRGGQVSWRDDSHSRNWQLVAAGSEDQYISAKGQGSLLNPFSAPYD